MLPEKPEALSLVIRCAGYLTKIGGRDIGKSIFKARAVKTSVVN